MKKILLFSPYGQWGIHNQVDAVFAKALELRGNQVLVTMCDGLYSDCMILRDVPYSQSNIVCKSCSNSGIQLFSAFQLPQQQLRQFIHADDIDEINQWISTISPSEYPNACYGDIPIGDWVTSSIYTYFRITPKGLQRRDVQEVHRNYLIDGLKTYKAFYRLLDAYQPDHVIHFNGRMAPYRVAFEVCRSRNIEVLTHERGFIDDSFSFLHNLTCSQIPQALVKYVQAWKDIPLNKQQIEQVHTYFLQREAGQNTNWNSFYTYKTDYSKVRHQLGIPSEAKILSVFTSSEDELVLSKDYEGLSYQTKILQHLIEIFRERDEYLVIRHHPHIGGAGGNRVETNFITRAYAQALTIPRNVRIVMPSEPLTSYSLIANTSAAIAFFSTMSIEAVARGVPTAVFENSPYSQALSQTLSSQKLTKIDLEDVVDALLKPSSLLSADDFRKLYRFTYNYFFRFSQKFKSFGIKDRHYLDIRIQSFEELQPGNDLNLDQICDHITDGTPLYETPHLTQIDLECNSETEFLRNEMKSISERRSVLNAVEPDKDTATIHIIHTKYPSEIHSSMLSYQSQKVFRHTNFSSEVLTISDAGSMEATLALFESVSSRNEEYILIANQYMQYDESFTLIALDRIENSKKDDIKSVLAGGWLLSQEKGIYEQIFTKSTEVLDYSKIVQILPEIVRQPLLLFSFLLIERSQLLDLLRLLSFTKDLRGMGELIFSHSIFQNAYMTGAPLIVVHQDKIREAYHNKAECYRPSVTLF